MTSVTTIKLGRMRAWPKIVATLSAAFFILCVGWFPWARPDQWGFRRALPRSAKDVHEWSWSDGFLPDYSYYLKARITDDEFQRYIAEFELKPHSVTRAYSEPAQGYLGWRGEPECEWWDPSDSLEHTFVDEGHDTWTFAKYERGYLYLKSLNH